MRLSTTSRLLIALVAGLAIGAVLPSAGADASRTIVSVVEPFGILWVNAIRMTVIPLVVALLIVGIAGSRDTRAIGRVGFRALVLCVAMLAMGAVAIALIGPQLMRALPLDPAAVDALRRQSSAPAIATGGNTGFASWVTSLVPVNAMNAAAEGALLPLVVFSILFALAASRIEPGPRAALVTFFRAVGDAMLVLVRWILAVAPMGVFALALPLASRLGLAAAGALAYYLAVVAAVCIALVIASMAVAAIFGRISPRALLRAAAPAQAVAFSSRSSLASLPALVQGAERLGFPSAVTAFFLPLAVATFRLGAVTALVLGPLFLARLYGIAITPAQLATIALSSVLLSFSVPGIPGGSVLVIAPVLASVGIPAAGLGVLLAIDTAPDMFRTLANVTADMAAAVILARGAPTGTAGAGAGAGAAATGAATGAAGAAAEEPGAF